MNAGETPVVKANEKPDAEQRGRLTRRQFLALSAAGAVSVFLAGCTKAGREAFFQSRFRELTGKDMDKVIARLEKQYDEQYGRKASVSVAQAAEGVLFGYGLDLSRCIGCRRCVYACVEENNLSRDPQIHWIRVLRMKKDRGVDIMESDAYYNPAEVPEPEAFYMPVQCQQCRRPPCVQVCPVKATWQEPDGIVVVDYNWCVGCRCCMAACPYGARHFNWGTPSLPREQLNPRTHYLGNRPRPRGVVEKCTFCIQRSRAGRYPACVEVCPVGARKFGNLLDEQSEIRYILRETRVFIFKEDLNTQPKFYYFYAT
jgi:Fe-S-cluster-containing dehydrogenase component